MTRKFLRPYRNAGRRMYRRRNYGYRAKRPVDKIMQNQYDPSVGTTQVDNALYTAPVACTYSGGRIVGNINTLSAGSTSTLIWVLVFVPQGLTPSAINTADNGTPYNPEADVLACGMIEAPITSGNAHVYEIDTVIKAKRKMKTGDAIYLSYKATAASASALGMIHTLFIKQ